MKKINDRKINSLIKEYNTVVKVMDSNAKKQTERSFGGLIRATKGKLQEHITEELIRISWDELGGDKKKLKINSSKVKIPIKNKYVDNLKDNVVKKYLKENITSYFFNASVDKQIFINKKFVVGIECKAYTENAMIKRILVDFTLLKTKFPKLKCFLFQLESQLGGDYSELKEITYGSKSAHTLMSYFENVDLQILTFLKGERKIDKPIHKNFKPLPKKSLIKAVEILKKSLKEFK